MTATHGVGTYGNAVGTVTPLDHKMAQLGLIVKTAANTIRPGLFWDGNATVVSGKANMSYDVRALAAVLSRSATAGAVLLTNDAVFNVVTTAAPGSNSRYDVVYLWQREFSIDGTDSNPVIGVVQGTAAASPTVPSLAAFPGAISLAQILVPAGVTATNSGTTITQTAPFTAAAGGVVAFRNTTERDAGSYQESQLGWLIDSNTLQVFDGTTFNPVSPAVLTCRVTRNTNTPSVPSSGFTDMSTTANWLTTTPAAQNVGFAAYSNGITIPVTGVYRIGYAVTSASNIALLSGITVNKSTSVAFTDFKAATAATPVQSGTGVIASTTMHLAAGDALRLFAIAASGTPALTASMGEFYAEWLRAD